jgi:hypothetical protein
MEYIKYEKLTPQQRREAEALYLHLLNHKEVQDAVMNKNKPMCRICMKTAYDIWYDTVK